MRFRRRENQLKLQNETVQATGFVPFDELSAYEKIGKVLTNHHFHVSTISCYYLKIFEILDDNVSDGFG